MEERRRCTTVRQLEALIEFLKEHRDLALGRVRSKEARAVADRLWRQCAMILNPLGPPRTAKEWSKAWNDQKYKVRAKLVAIKSNQRGTGGGLNNTPPTLTTLEKRIANMLSRDPGPMVKIKQDPLSMDEDSTMAEELEDSKEQTNSPSIEQNHDSPPIGQINDTPSLGPIVDSPSVGQIIDITDIKQNDSPPIVLNIQYQEPPPPQEPQSDPPADRREERRRKFTRPSRNPSARNALDESRSLILKIEELRAQAALQTAQAANRNSQALMTLAESFKLIAVGINIMCQQYSFSRDRQDPC